MRSLIIIEVEHGETTDAFTQLAESLGATPPVGDVRGMPYAYITDWTVKVDIPECFVLA